MTAIFYPDLSHYDLDRGVRVEAGTVAVIAKATHGTLFLDRGYATLKQQAANVGAVFAGYHWLNHGNAAAQADYYYSQVGATPCMVDAEDEPGNSGYNGPLTVQDIVDFVTRLRALGGVCNLVYLPKWFWQKSRTPDAGGKVGMGSPDLTPLARLGVGLVSSNYTTYSDSGPGWAPYGGVTPVAWQYTDALPYGGSTCDFNAFRGDLDQFRTLLTGGPDMASPLDDPNFAAHFYALIFRVAALVDGAETLPDDPVLPAQLRNSPIHVSTVLKQTAADAAAAKATGDTNATALANLAKVAAQSVAAPTQEQVDAAVLKALQDTGVQAGIGAAIASHLHVS